jgi:acetolactate synthase-1/2/3 large subunit
MGRNYPTDLAMVADVKESIKDLRAALESILTKERIAKFGEERATEVKGVASKMWSNIDAAMKKNMGGKVMHPDELTTLMAKNLEKNSVIVSEVHDGIPHYDVFPFGHREEDPMWLSYTSNGLGWGASAAIGAKLAAPDRPVVCSIGDGAVMYGSSAFWTQARYSIPVLTVVWNNKNYQTVRLGFNRYGGKMAATGQYAGMYLGDPDIDFVKLGESQGVKGEKANTAAEFEAALKRGVKATRDGKPYLIDAEITRIGGGAESTWHEGFKLTSKMKKQPGQA